MEIWSQHLGDSDDDSLAQGSINRSLKHKVSDLSFEIREELTGIQTQCGNGSLMRVSPVALVYHNNLETALKNAVRSSQVTHPYPTNSEACKVYTHLIIRTLEGVSKEDIAETLTNYAFEDPDLGLRFAKYTNVASFEAVKEQDISSSGYVVHTLEASLWAFFTTNTFEEGALKVVNLGNDADTVGAVYGGIVCTFRSSCFAHMWGTHSLMRLPKHDAAQKTVLN